MGLSVAVLGLGLIGGSLARRLQGAGVEVVGFDVSGETRAEAGSHGLRVVASIAEACAGSDVVVLAVPLRAMRTVTADVTSAVAPTALVTDVGSVKGPVREAMVAAGLGDRYVGAHPMAGTEESGFSASSETLLDGARWAVTVTEATDPGRLTTLLSLITGPLGGTAHVLTDEVHDEAVALVSHVPHVLATELLNVVASAPIRELALGLAAGSFRDGTRVGRTDPRRTEAMVTDNAAWVAPALRVMVRDLERLADSLESNGPTGAFFDQADVIRRAATDPAADASPTGTAASSAEASAVDLGGPGWFAELTSQGAAGRYVVQVEGTRAVLR